MNVRPTHYYSRGMTLLELMIVVVIATILIGVAIPSYRAQIQQSRRVQAKTALVDLAGREERFYSATGSSYSQLGTALGYASPAWPQAVGDNYYNVSVCATGAAVTTCNPSPQTDPAYVVSAKSINSQAGDTQCAYFAVDSAGQRWAHDINGNDTTTLCWNN